jgi:hypothetical protein
VLSDEVSDYGPTRAHYSAHVGGPAPRSTVDSLGAPSLVRDEEVSGISAIRDEHNAYPDQYDRAARTMSIFTTARGRFVT